MQRFLGFFFELPLPVVNDDVQAVLVFCQGLSQPNHITHFFHAPIHSSHQRLRPRIPQAGRVPGNLGSTRYT